MPDRVLLALSALFVLVACTTITPDDRRANYKHWADCVTNHNHAADGRVWLKRCSS